MILPGTHFFSMAGEGSEHLMRSFIEVSFKTIPFQQFLQSDLRNINH